MNLDYLAEKIEKNTGLKIQKSFVSMVLGKENPKYNLKSCISSKGDGFYFNISGKRYWDRSDIDSVKDILIEEGFEPSSFMDYERDDDRSWPARFSFFPVSIEEEIDFLVSL